MKWLKILAWLVVPYIMLLIRWKKLNKAKRMAALAWSFIILIAGITGPEESQPTTAPTPVETPAAAAASAPAISASITPTSTPPASSSASDTVQTNFISAKVIRIVDGDTIEVEIDGRKETVRMLLVDTPETKKPGTPVQPMGLDAYEFTKATLEGQEVRLEKDVSERDQYGRLLMYVYLGDKMVNEMLLERGLARVAVFPPDVKYVEAFRQISRKAQEAALGIWSIENYVTDKGYVVKEEPSSSTAVQATVKPTAPPAPQQQQKATNSNVYYANCDAVRAAGKAPLYQGDPGYSTKLDRDKDGVACEK